MKLQRDRMERHKRKRVEQYTLIDKKKNSGKPSLTRKLTTHKTVPVMKNNKGYSMIYGENYTSSHHIVKNETKSLHPIKNEVPHPIKNEKKSGEKYIVYDKTSPLQMEDGVSIIISGYGNEEYILETMESIFKQTYKKYEILLGIDGDLNLLYFVQKNKEKFKNVRVFYHPLNMGPYLIFNAMALQCKYDKIVRFDTDDIMPQDYIELLVKELNGYDAVKPYGINFGLNNQKLEYRHGYFIMKKNKFIEIGGFQPWVCDADGEMYDRTQSILKWKKVTNIVFKRRIHGNNLTNDKKRGLKSEIRKKYRKYRKEISPNCPIIDYNTIKIYSEVNNFCPIISFTTYNRRFGVVNKMIESILKQTYKPYQIICNVTQEDYNKFPNKYKSKILFNIVKEDLRPHNKYYWTMLNNREFPIITLDDDYIYDKTLIETLMKSTIKLGKGVFSLRTHQKTYSNKKLNKYNLWKKEIKTGDNNLFPTGVGGVLYTANILNVNETWLPVIKKYITVDDMVLNYYEVKQHVKITHVENNVHNSPIKEVQSIGLYVNENTINNDIAINNLLNTVS